MDLRKEGVSTKEELVDSRSERKGKRICGFPKRRKEGRELVVSQKEKLVYESELADSPKGEFGFSESGFSTKGKSLWIL